MFFATKTLAARRTLAIPRQHGTYIYTNTRSLPRGRSNTNTTTMGACFSTNASTSSSNTRTEVVLAYWLGDPVRYRATWDPCATPENQTKWFMKSDEVDREIKERFGGDVARLPEIITAATASGTTEDKVAAIILGDQMTRNMYRGTSEMYRWDSIVLPLAKLMVGRDDFMSLPLTFKMFSLLPLMHSGRYQTPPAPDLNQSSRTHALDSSRRGVGGPAGVCRLGAADTGGRAGGGGGGQGVSG